MTLYVYHCSEGELSPTTGTVLTKFIFTWKQSGRAVSRLVKHWFSSAAASLEKPASIVYVSSEQVLFAAKQQNSLVPVTRNVSLFVVLSNSSASRSSHPRKITLTCTSFVPSSPWLSPSFSHSQSMLPLFHKSGGRCLRIFILST